MPESFDEQFPTEVPFDTLLAHLNSSNLAALQKIGVYEVANALMKFLNDSRRRTSSKFVRPPSDPGAAKRMKEFQLMQETFVAGDWQIHLLRLLEYCGFEPALITVELSRRRWSDPAALQNAARRLGWPPITAASDDEEE